MNEDILSASIESDEAESFVGIIPLHGAFTLLLQDIRSCLARCSLDRPLRYGTVRGSDDHTRHLCDVRALLPLLDPYLEAVSRGHHA